jgi:3-deoxy-manno-octulosonate cytidylyltransferase (CMP-KDO synthetase)
MTAEAAAVIPARYGSTRFPGKVLADLGGKPVLRWVYDNCLASEVFSRVVVAADSDEVRRAA